jgi:hypothetical protein
LIPACFAAFALAALTAAHRFFVAVMIAFLPTALSFRFGLEGFDVAFDVRLECFPVGFFAVLEDACELTASFVRVTAAFASCSSSRMWGALSEYRSITSDINTSILASRLRALFAFMTTPFRHA